MYTCRGVSAGWLATDDDSTMSATIDRQRSRMVPCERWALTAFAVSGAVFLPEALNRFVFAKLALVALGVLLALASPCRGRLPAAARAMLAAGGLVLLVAALSGSTPVAQLLGRAPRYEGVFVLPVYLGALIGAARLLGAERAPGSMQWFLRWLALASLAVGIEAALEAAGLRPLPGDVARLGSLLGNASDEGAWALLALGPLLSVALRVRGRLYVLGALAAATALVCSGSRGALAGAAALAVTLAVLAPRRGQRVAVAVVLAATALGALALPTTRSRVLGTSPLANVTIQGRSLLWGETAQMIGAHPMLGVGPGGYLDAIPAYHTPGYERAVGPADPPDSPHNWLLQATVAGGLPLALLALALAGLTLCRGYRATRRAAPGEETAALAGMLAGLVGYGSALLFHFTSPGTTPLAAVLCGALLSARPRASPEPSLRSTRVTSPGTRALAGHSAMLALVCKSGRRASAVTFGLLAILLGAAALAEVPLRAAIAASSAGNFVLAKRDFDLAAALRPWDADIAATAAHVDATLAEAGITTIARAGTGWSSIALARDPHSIQALEDGATLAEASGNLGRASALLAQALAMQRDDPDLLIRAGILAVAQHEPAVALVRVRRAAALMPAQAVAWQALAMAYRGQGDRALAALATIHAERLSRGPATQAHLSPLQMRLVSSTLSARLKSRSSPHADTLTRARQDREAHRP
jgi:O-antigen ligase